jgi:glycosyltransferase involved in cell wall biosynthesis
MAGRRASVHLAKANVSVSQYLGQRLGLPRSVTIYNPVDARAFLSGGLGPGEEGVVAFAGRLHDKKGLNVLIRTLALVPEARLEVVGGPPGLWPRRKELAEVWSRRPCQLRWLEGPKRSSRALCARRCGLRADPD